MAESPVSHQRFVLSAPVLSSPGTFEYRLVPLREARHWLNRGPYVSLIRHEVVAEATQILLGELPPIEYAQRRAFMKVGDEALIVNFKAGNLANMKREDISPDFVRSRTDVGLLRRVA